MIPSSAIPVLQQLLALLQRSFPQYLMYSRPYVPAGRANIMETFDSIVADQEVLAERVSRMLIDAECPPRSGEFPMEYTDLHDLDIDFLVGSAIAYQHQDIDTLQQLVEQLQQAPAAKSLAEEALGMAKGHLDSLKELQQPVTS